MAQADIPSPDVLGNPVYTEAYVYVISAGGSATAMAELSEARLKLKEQAA